MKKKKITNKGKKLKELKENIKVIIDDSVPPREKRQVRERLEFIKRAIREMEDSLKKERKRKKRLKKDKV